MKKADLIYICTTLGNLSGIPVRLFSRGELIFMHSLVNLSKDPMNLYREQIWRIDSHIGYFITPFFNYYGIVNFGTYRLVAGPTSQVPLDRQEMKTLAFQLDIPQGETESFIAAMDSIVRLPLDSVMQMLCAINFALNKKEKLQLSDIAIIDTEQENLRRQLVTQYSEEELQVQPSSTYQTVDNSPTDYGYTSYNMEKQLMELISKGDTATLQEWVKKAPAVRPGILSNSQLRQQKNIFIVAATLASRAAIKGGLAEETSFRLSDAYIQKCELLNDPALISNLEYHMILDYTERVESIRVGKHPSDLTIKVANFVQQHICEPITAEAVADSLFMSKSRLFTKFKAESGETLSTFILKEKTQAAKRLLRYTNKTATAIGMHLGFSSQSHFTRVFKKYTGMTPGKYREESKLALG